MSCDILVDCTGQEPALTPTSKYTYSAWCKIFTQVHKLFFNDIQVESTWPIEEEEEEEEINKWHRLLYLEQTVHVAWKSVRLESRQTFSLVPLISWHMTQFPQSAPLLPACIHFWKEFGIQFQLIGTVLTDRLQTV